MIDEGAWTIVCGRKIHGIKEMHTLTSLHIYAHRSTNCYLHVLCINFHWNSQKGFGGILKTLGPRAKTPSNMERQHSHCDMYISIFPHNFIKIVQNVQVWGAVIPKYLALKPLTPRGITLSKMEGQHSSCNMNIYKLRFVFVSNFIAIPFRFRSWMWRHYLDVENSKFKGQNSLLKNGNTAIPL